MFRLQAELLCASVLAHQQYLYLVGEREKSRFLESGVMHRSTGAENESTIKREENIATRGLLRLPR